MIKERREELNMTQQELADKMGVSRIAVVHWEQGEALPRAGKLKKLSEVLDCPIDIFLH